MPTGYPTTVSTSFLPDRGYTGYSLSRQSGKILDAFGLINMNGRMYDPTNARFLSPDPFVQDPLNTQSYNRFSYAFNNPMMYIDPSGYTNKDGKDDDDYLTPDEEAARRRRREQERELEEYYRQINMDKEVANAKIERELNNQGLLDAYLAAKVVYEKKLADQYRKEREAIAARSMSELNSRGSGDYDLNLSGNNDTDGGSIEPGGENGAGGGPNIDDYIDDGGILPGIDDLKSAISWMRKASSIPNPADINAPVGGIGKEIYVFELIDSNGKYSYYIMPWNKKDDNGDVNGPCRSNIFPDDLRKLIGQGYAINAGLHTHNSCSGETNITIDDYAIFDYFSNKWNFGVLPSIYVIGNYGYGKFNIGDTPVKTSDGNHYVTKQYK